MLEQPFLFDAGLLQKEIYELHMKRKKGKIPSKRLGRLTKNERLSILSKTDNRCHICGIDVSLADFQADHVVAHICGGQHEIDNYLPSCFTCNNYRWHYLSSEVHLILKLGVWAKTEIEKGTILGNSMATKFVHKETERVRRKKSSQNNSIQSAKKSIGKSLETSDILCLSAMRYLPPGQRHNRQTFITTFINRLHCKKVIVF